MSFIYILVTLSVLLLPWQLLWRLLFLVVLYAVSRWQLARHAAYDLIVWQSGNYWLLQSANTTTSAELLTQSLITPWLVILLFRLQDRHKHTELIWADTVDPDVFRRLRVRLKLEADSLFRHDTGR